MATQKKTTGYLTLAVDDERNKLIQNRTYCLRVVLAIFTAIVVIGVAIVAIVAIVYSSNANAVQRYCVQSEDVLGFIRTELNDREISWNLQYTPVVGTIVSLHIMGPIPLEVTDGPLNIALCGSPSTLACGASVPNQLADSIWEKSPGGNGLKPTIQAIRKEPWRYYALLNRGSGAPIRLSLGQICGTE